jgi:VWFA-related protein
MFRWSSLAVLFALSGACFADNVTYLRIDSSIVQQRLEKAPQVADDRVRALGQMFAKAGCPAAQVQVQPVPKQSLPNVLCTLPGSEKGTILIAARIDYDGRGEESEVGWGGIVMLPLLAESLTSAAHRHTLVFAAFSGANLAGANWYWKNLTDQQRGEFRGMVDLDHVGRTAAGFSAASSGAVMARLLPAAARALRIAPEPLLLPNTPDNDAEFFQHAHVPAITIYSPGYAVSGLAPSSPADASPLYPKDVRKVAPPTPSSFALKTAVDPAIYYQTYNLLCVFVLFLDRGLGASQRPAAEVQVAKAAKPTKAEETVVPPVVAPVPPTNTAPVLASSNPAAPASSASDAPAPSLPATSPSTGSVPPGGPAETIRVNARLVQFDVVVTDKQGKPVTNLGESDFTVLQDGKPQTIGAFELHTPAPTTPLAATGTASPGASTSANAYTNSPAKAPQSSWTIVLFDLLNTGVPEQSYARNQLLQLLKSTPPGQPVALFVLTRQLEMVQGFTQDPTQLLHVAEQLIPTKSQNLTTMVERERTIGSIVATAQQAAPSGGSPANAPAYSTDSIAYAQASRIQQGYNDHEAFRTSDRALFTLQAMKGLARAVSGYPGRKNLIWMSGSFPVQIEPDPAAFDPFRNMRGFADEIRSASSLLATSRVAVYPVDVRGLQSKGIDITVASAENQSMSDVLPATATNVVASSSSSLGATLNAETVSLADERTTMNNIAQQTGGQAFVNTNDLRRVIGRASEDGSTYYTLAYTPPKEDEGSYHQVTVKLADKNLKLAYRRGYYSIPQPQSGGEAGAAALRAALQPGMPPATSVLFTTSIEVPDATRRDVKINYVIDSNGVNFADAPDSRKRAQVDCMVIAFDSSGKEVAHASDTLDATIPPNAYAAILTYGLPTHQLITLPPGRYNLRIGVMDRTTQGIGTVDAPLVVPAAQAQR